MLGVNEMTIRRWIDDGKMTAIRLPGRVIRIHQDEVTRILSNVITKTERD